jgi:uncharacterized protein (UPF0212 family)
MTKVTRWVTGIHRQCPTCGKIQEGVLMIHNNDVTGLTEKLTLDCYHCHKEFYP